MARPKDADPKETRRRILQCACDLLSDTTETFSLRAVARKAEVSVGTLQYHFADKRVLMDACIDTVYETFSQLVPTFISELGVTTDANELISKAVRFGFAYSRKNRPFIRVLEASIVENGGLDLARHSATQQPFIENVSRLLATSSELSSQEIRLRMNSLVLLIGRYAILEESAMAALFTPEEGKTILGTVEEHLVSMALCLLGPRTPK